MTNAEHPTAGIARRHDLDALRAFAMLLGIVLHGALAFIPGDWPVTDASVEGNGMPFKLLTMAIHGFRMPLFFLMSGFFTAMLWRQRGLRALVRQRAQRLLLPLVIAMLTVIPLTWAAWGYAASTPTVDDGGPGAGVEISAQDNIWVAAALGDMAALEGHLAAGASLDAYDPIFGVTPLSWTALHGRREMAAWLLDTGAEVGARNRDGGTALHAAAFMGRVEIVQLLLERGADAQAVDANGARPLDSGRVDAETTAWIAELLGGSNSWQKSGVFRSNPAFSVRLGCVQWRKRSGRNRPLAIRRCWEHRPMPQSATSHLKGVGKAHRIALDPTDRQATRMLEHAGWARVAANWARGRFQLAWFGETDEQHADDWHAHVEGHPDGGEWLSDMDLRKDFNAVKTDLFAWSGGLSQHVAKNAIIDMGAGLKAWGAYCKARKHGPIPPQGRLPAGPQAVPQDRLHTIQRPQQHPGGRMPRASAQNRLGADARGTAVCRRHPARHGRPQGRALVRVVHGGHVRARTRAQARPRHRHRHGGEDAGRGVGWREKDGRGPSAGLGIQVEVVAPPGPGHCPQHQYARQAQTIQTQGRPVRPAQPAARRHRQPESRPPPQGHHANSQTRRHGEVETLNVSGMKKNRRLARAIGDAGMAEFVRQLEYKCAWYGTGFERVDRWYPSSKTCSACGAVKQSLLLSERTYRCHRCGFECDRDENAARNLQAYTGHPEPARHLNEFPRAGEVRRRRKWTWRPVGRTAERPAHGP